MDLMQVYHLYEIGGKNNQEDFIWPTPGSADINDKIFIVCDGVGGSDNGEIASKIIAETTGLMLVNEKSGLNQSLIMSALKHAHNELIEHACDYGLSNDMATTFTILALNDSDNSATLAWCGDSRVYHFRKGKVLYKTSDHSLVNSLVKSGELSEEDALTHPRKNIILRAVKASQVELDPDFHTINDIQDGDYFMLCTDGLLENVSDSLLCDILERHDSSNLNIIDELQNHCFGNTRDNYSMYLIKIKKTGNSSYNLTMAEDTSYKEII